MESRCRRSGGVFRGRLGGALTEERVTGGSGAKRSHVRELDHRARFQPLPRAARRAGFRPAAPDRGHVPVIRRGRIRLRREPQLAVLGAGEARGAAARGRAGRHGRGRGHERRRAAEVRGRARNRAASPGDLVSVRNPATETCFPARVAAKGKVTAGCDSWSYCVLRCCSWRPRRARPLRNETGRADAALDADRGLRQGRRGAGTLASSGSRLDLAAGRAAGRSGARSQGRTGGRPGDDRGGRKRLGGLDRHHQDVAPIQLRSIRSPRC